MLTEILTTGFVQILEKYHKVLEFNVEIFKVLISLENDNWCRKVWKNP